MMPKPSFAVIHAHPNGRAHWSCASIAALVLVAACSDAEQGTSAPPTHNCGGGSGAASGSTSGTTASGDATTGSLPSTGEGASGAMSDSAAAEPAEAAMSESGSGAGPVPDSGAATFTPGPPYIAPAHQGNLVHVKNGCSFPLWIHGVGGGGILMPDNIELTPGDMHDYSVGDWPFAYVQAYLDASQKNVVDQAELTMFPAGLVSYRLAYIDGIGLPMELQAIGAGADCKAVGCYATQAQIMAECPNGLLSGMRCQSAGVYCSDPANAANPYCHALDGAIAKCAQTVSGCQDAAGATTANAYNCEQFFGDHQALCAVVNRGMVGDPTNSDNSVYYSAQPYNTYAAWLHGLCPGLYTFPYDDVQASQDAFHACQSSTSSTQLNVTFCPAG
jgi:hypothetical protein